MGVEPTVTDLQSVANAQNTRKKWGLPILVAQKVATDTAENGCERLMLAAETDADLARLVSAWPMLPAHIRATIATVLRSVLGEDDPAKR